MEGGGETKTFLAFILVTIWWRRWRGGEGRWWDEMRHSLQPLRKSSSTWGSLKRSEVCESILACPCVSSILPDSFFFFTLNSLNKTCVRLWFSAYVNNCEFMENIETLSVNCQFTQTNMACVCVLCVCRVHGNEWPLADRVPALWLAVLHISQIKDVSFNLNPCEAARLGSALPRVCAAGLVLQLEGTQRCSWIWSQRRMQLGRTLKISRWWHYDPPC